MCFGCANRTVESVTAFIGGSLIVLFFIKWPRLIIPLIVIFFFLLSIVASIEKSFRERNRRKCPHGIVDGDRMDKQHRYKCPQCEAEREKRQRERAEEQQKQEERRRFLYEYEEAMEEATEIWRKQTLASSSVLDKLTPHEFEDYIADLLPLMGYDRIERTPYVNDGGKDIICYFQGKKVYVECKHYGDKNTVGRPLMQKLYAAMTEDHVTRGMFVTTSSFTTSAFKYGMTYNIETIDGNELKTLIGKYHRQTDVSDQYTLPCPECGQPVAFRFSKIPEKVYCPNNHRVSGITDPELYPKQKEPIMKI